MKRGKMLLYDVLGFVAAAFIMVKAANYALKAVFRIEKNLKISSFVISFFLIGLVSAFPETFISVVSAFEGIPQLGFGTLMGSVIVDLSLILGIVGIVAGQSKLEKGFKHELWLLMLLLLPVVLAMDGTISRIDGIVLIGGYFMFLYNLLQKTNLIKKIADGSRNHMPKHLAVFLASSAVVFASAYFIVKFSKALAAELGISLLLVGLIMIALATSLPEFVFALAAVKKKLADVAVGELLGVVVIDATLLMGVIALISPINVEGIDLGKIGIFIFTVLALAAYFLREERIFTWKDGIIMVFIYLVFLITELTTTRLSPV